MFTRLDHALFYFYFIQGFRCDIYLLHKFLLNIRTFFTQIFKFMSLMIIYEAKITNKFLILFAKIPKLHIIMYRTLKFGGV